MRNLKSILLWLAIIVAAGAVSLWQKSDDPPSGPVIATVADQSPAPPAPRQRTEEPRGAPTDRQEPAAGEEWPRVRQLVTDAVEREQLLKTLDLIERGGPFPYPKKDGTTFGNRERQLPSKPKGYYREYTVPTPGASNRGARRVVQGKSGETYYTNDHYASFIRIDGE
jgi:ribonuclease T1